MNPFRITLLPLSLTLTLSLALVSGCTTQATEIGEIAEIELNPDSAVLEIGETKTLSARARDASGATLPDVDFVWTSSREGVAVVDGGVVEALGAGQARITASAEGTTSAPCIIDVSDPPPTEVDFEITLSADKLPVMQGEEASITATVTRKDGFAESISVTLSGLPDGASVDPIEIAADEDEAAVTVRALASAPHSLPTEVEVTAEAQGVERNQALTVTVYGPPGSLDTSFAGGKVTVPVGGSDDYANAMAVQADGKILVAGRSYERRGDFALIRLERDGELDTSFGSQGIVTTDFGDSSDIGYAVAVQTDGKIVVAGVTTLDAEQSFAVARYTAGGEPDAEFGEQGRVTTPLVVGTETAYALLLLADGRIVVAGDASQGTSQSGQDFALVAYEENGELDLDFGDGGKVLTPVGAGNARDSVYGLAVQRVGGEDRIVAVGGEGDFSIARYLDDGTLDTSFGDGGTLAGVWGSVIGAARAAHATADGKVVIAGHNGHDFALVQLDADGELDMGFGDGGKVLTPVSADNWDEVHGLALESNGNIVLGGWVYQGASSNGNFALARYDAQGELDETFGESGLVVTEVAKDDKHDQGVAAVLQADERIPMTRILVAGSANDSNLDFAVTRYWP